MRKIKPIMLSLCYKVNWRIMGKHSKSNTFKTPNRKKVIATGAITLGLLMSQTSAYAATDQAPQQDSIQRVAEKAQIYSEAQANIVAPSVTASKDATVSFEKPAIKTARSQASIDAEAKAKADEAAKVEAEKQAVIDAENAKVAAAQAVKVQEAQVAQAAQARTTNTGAAAYGAPASTAPASANASSVPVSGKRAAILAAARAQIGVAQDCTMLVTNSLKAVGINFHDWPAGYLTLGPVTTNPQPGDLIYYANGGSGMAHIAVVSDKPGMAIHGGFNGNSTVEFSANVGSGPVYISMG
jgi:hypothetical protein